jgi:hypothetical protein
MLSTGKSVFAIDLAHDVYDFWSEHLTTLQSGKELPKSE